MSQKTIFQGAEAIIIKKGTVIVKRRVKKGYRHPLLDEKLRKQRTRQEARIVEKVAGVIPTAKLQSVDEQKYELTLSYLGAKNLAATFDKVSNKKALCTAIGRAIAHMHDIGIVHGDLTTSNIMIKDKKPHIIDFGLGFHSTRSEDRAVDLHVLKEALEARHPTHAGAAFASVLHGYGASKDAAKTLKQLKKVEQRGRYKAHY